MKNIILGIDTGGTYTDGVLIRCDTKEVIRSAKAFTTKNNLSVGIINCIDKLKIEEGSICLVCLSTTLATNSVVEGCESKVGLIVIGEEKNMQREKEYPSTMMKYIEGKIDILGRETKPIKKNDVNNALNEMKGRVDTLAISGFASVKNPSHELIVKKTAEKSLGIPIVCAHELTTSLGFYERTVTTVLNAQLIPLICTLISDTEAALKARRIDVPLTVVKGDGHSMISDYAKFCPVETVLSGPAASVIGGKFLTGEKDALIVDMGGTTTDIVCIDNYEAILEKEGMNIEGWKTRIKSVKVSTFGLGGDSHIKMTTAKELTFGPRKVKPICVAAYEYPYLCDELKQYRLPADYLIQRIQPVDIFYLTDVCDEDCHSLDEKNRKLISMLEGGPHSAVYLSQGIGTDIDNLNIESLVSEGIIGIVSLTPTDLVHASGQYQQWNSQASKIAIEIIAEKMGMTSHNFIQYAEDLFVDKICRCMIESIVEIDRLGQDLPPKQIAEFIYSRDHKGDIASHYSLNFKLNRPVIGIGAPAPVWLKKAAEKLNADFKVPKYSEVANAIGAAVGDVRERIEAVICYDQLLDNYVVYLPNERMTYSNLKEAKETAYIMLLRYANDFSNRLGTADPEITINVEDFEIDNNCTGVKTFVKSTLSAVIEGEFEKAY